MMKSTHPAGIVNLRARRVNAALNTRALITAAALFVFGCLPVAAQGKLNVVSATEDLAAIAREVGGDRISVEAIAKGYQDPHFVETYPARHGWVPTDTPSHDPAQAERHFTELFKLFDETLRG